MNGEFHLEPANDQRVVALEALAPLAAPRKPLLLLQLAQPLRSALVLRWTCEALGQSGELALPPGDRSLLCPLPADMAGPFAPEGVEFRISAAWLEPPARGSAREPLDLWRRQAGFSLWSQSGAAIAFAGSRADAANENAFFVTVDDCRVAVDFAQLASLQLRRVGGDGQTVATLTVAPCLYS